MAFDQPTFMSSTHNEPSCPAGCLSERAVDGDLSTTTARCSVTATEDKPWWAVKLSRDDNIAKVVVTNRDKNGGKEL